MLKVFIVDDEYYFREALKVAINWERMGYEICGEAKNGRDALSKIEQISPDVVLLDINMPIMDGLDVAQAIKDQKIESKVVIVTGHDEFNYAKQAVQLGVHDYILKPIDKKELMTTLVNIKQIIQKESNIKIEMDTLKTQVKESIPYLREKYLNELIQGNRVLDKEKIYSKLDDLDIDIISQCYQVVIIEIDYEDHSEWHEKDKQLWDFAVLNITEELLFDELRGVTCHDSDDRICIIMGYNQNEEEKNYMSIVSKLEQIKSAIKKHLDFTVTAGIGNIYTNIYDVSNSCNEALNALKNKIILGNDQIIRYNLISETRLSYNFYPLKYRKQLLMSMRMGSIDEVYNLIDKIFCEVKLRNIHLELLLVICVEMISTCLEFVAETEISLNEISEAYIYGMFENIQSKKSIDDMQVYIKRMYTDIIGLVNKKKKVKSSRIVKKVIDFIGENYSSEALSIGILAKNLYINYGHLCYIFKRDMGITINEYITEFRMKKAKELIEAGNNYVMNVANKVGYMNANYFSKCFKKYYGISPSQYIERIQAKNR